MAVEVVLIFFARRQMSAFLCEVTELISGCHDIFFPDANQEGLEHMFVFLICHWFLLLIATWRCNW